MNENDLRLRESMWKSIFDRPLDESLRLIVADWFDEQGDTDIATLLRNERIPHNLADSISVKPGFLKEDRHEIMTRNLPGFSIRICEDTDPCSTFRIHQPTNLFREGNTVTGTVEGLSNDTAIRVRSVTIEPILFLTRKIIVNDGFIRDADLFDAIDRCPAFKRVDQLNLSAKILPDNAIKKTSGGLVPLIGLRGIRALANHPLAAKIRYLGLSYNQLNDEAATVLIHSPRLQKVHLSITCGNRFSSRTWTQLRERFGYSM